MYIDVMIDFFNWIHRLFEQCHELDEIEKKQRLIDMEIHMIPFRYDLCKKNHRPFKKTKKSVSWSAGDRVEMTFSNEEYDRTIDRFQLKKNIFLCVILKRGDVL
jgi:hypothetical protein